MFMIRSIRSLTIALSLTITVPLVTSCASAAATKASTKTTKSTKPRKAAKKPVKRPVVTTIKPTVTPRPVTTVKPVVTANEKVLAGYESYLAAFVAGAREPGRAKELLPTGMTGDALAKLLEIRRLDAVDGVYWDGTRADIIVGPRIETVGATTATLRDCRSVGGVLRNLSTKEAVAGTTEPDIDDLRVTLVLIAGRWVVTANDRFNDVEGRSKCVPGAISP